MIPRAPRSKIDGYARQMPPRRRRPSWRAVSVVMALLGVGAAVALLALIQQAAVAADRRAWLDRATAAVGFKIVRVETSGHRATSRASILEALGISPETSQLGFDVASAERRIEALPWVLKAKVQRVLPDAINVEIIERKAAILWRAPTNDVLIDMQGRELTVVQRGTDIGLPVVTGSDAGTAAPDLIALIEQHPEIERRMIEARRIDGRRWTLQLSSGTLVLLPGDGTAAALAWLEAQVPAGLLERGLAAIDLRVPGQLVVRPGDGGPLKSGRADQQTARSSSAGGPL